MTAPAQTPPAEGPAKVHPTAVVHETARLGPGVEVGPYAVIGPETEVGAGAWIGPHAVVEYATIGPGCKVHPHAFVGTPPQDLKYKGEKTRAVLGARTVVRECVTVNRGTAATGVTRVGEDCLLMAYSHVAHDCVLGNNVIVANVGTFAGHVQVGDDVVVGGIAAVHQFTRIGRGAMIGGGSKVAADVAPFCMTHGDRATLVGLNVVGLRRRGLSRETFAAIKDAYKTVFHTPLTLSEAIAKLETPHVTPEVRIFLDFLKSPSRGLCRPAFRDGDDEDAPEV